MLGFKGIESVEEFSKNYHIWILGAAVNVCSDMIFGTHNKDERSKAAWTDFQRKYWYKVKDIRYDDNMTVGAKLKNLEQVMIELIKERDSIETKSTVKDPTVEEKARAKKDAEERFNKDEKAHFDGKNSILEGDKFLNRIRSAISRERGSTTKSEKEIVLFAYYYTKFLNEKYSTDFEVYYNKPRKVEWRKEQYEEAWDYYERVILKKV